jgi:hypothetical protein
MATGCSIWVAPLSIIQWQIMIKKNGKLLGQQDYRQVTLLQKSQSYNANSPNSNNFLAKRAKPEKN